ncbi:MAG: AtpZ/AtpI family protein [Alphaproteobacteria bacterium]
MTQSASNGGPDQKGEPDFKEIKERLDDLGDGLERVRERNAPPEISSDKRGKAMGVAFRIAIELVVGVVFGGVVGWAFDSWLNTAPLMLIIFLLLGMAGGLLNAIRAAKSMQ